MNLSTLTDRELANKAHTELDRMTSTGLEAELIERFYSTLEFKEKLEKLVETFPMDFLTGLTSVFEDHYITDLSELREKLERADQFYDIARDAGDVVTRLADMVNKTL